MIKTRNIYNRLIVKIFIEKLTSQWYTKLRKNQKRRQKKCKKTK